jgi:microcin C transport system substrate-binding protein
VDRIIDDPLEAPGPEERDVALRALDRVLRWERFMIPVWFNANSWYAYWDQYPPPRKPAHLCRRGAGFLVVRRRARGRVRAAGALR